MRIATWNVNSIKQRIDNAVSWLAERQPDIVCLQETKCIDEAFPREAFEALRVNLLERSPSAIPAQDAMRAVLDREQTLIAQGQLFIAPKTSHRRAAPKREPLPEEGNWKEEARPRRRAFKDK